MNCPSTQFDKSLNAYSQLALSAAESIGSDEFLQASRRVDWRFLLPNSALRHVAYFGPQCGSLHDSLRLFSESLSVITGGRDDIVHGPDVVVLCNPTWNVLQLSVTFMNPGGVIYVETTNRQHVSLPRVTRHPGPRGFAEYVDCMEQLGLTAIQAFWNWPDFESCLEIVPLCDHKAINYALSRRGRGVGATLKTAAVRCLLGFGVLPHFVPCLSFVAAKNW